MAPAPLDRAPRLSGKVEPVRNFTRVLSAAYVFGRGTVSRLGPDASSHVQALSDSSNMPGPRAVLRILARSGARGRSKGTGRRGPSAPGAGHARPTTPDAGDKPVDARRQAGSGKLRCRHPRGELRDSADGKGD